MEVNEGGGARHWLLWAGLASLLIILPGGFCGFACLSNPCHYGICIDDINSTFSCYCIDGYTGVLCQTNWDECWSNPCSNGGTCFDGIAEFNCTCASGFQGDTCEINVNECESNPCHNNGTCMDGADGYTCVCAPGFVGSFCEQDVSVCNETGEERCQNGGLCIEGPGITYQCVCQPGWTGKYCGEAIDECESSPCMNGAVCLDHHANYSCACPFGYAGRNCEVELEMCGENSPCENGALCLIEDWMSVCYCVPDFHGDRCQYQYDECLLGPGCKNGGTCIDGIDSYICSCPPNLTGDFCECLIIDEGNYNCSYIRPTLQPPTVPIHVPTTSIPELTDGTTRSRRTTRADHSSSEVTSPLPVTAVFLPSVEPSTTECAALTSFEVTSQEASTDAKVETTITTTKDEDPTTTEHHEPDLIPQFPSTGETTKETVLPSPELPTTTNIAHSTEEQYESSSHRSVYQDTTSELIFPTSDEQTEFSTERPKNCRKVPCLNGGMCLNTTTGLRCVCKAGWEGPLCDEKQSVKVAAFSGQSYISHKLSNLTHIKVEITTRTVSPVGLILYAHLGPDVYMTLFLEDGLLKFKFSCGLQTMLLSEVQFHINNGYDLVATVTLEFLPPMKSNRLCLATVRVNNTLAMSGEQVAEQQLEDVSASWLHLGGVPNTDDSEPPITEGFVGCMHSLVINMQPKNILKEAFNSNDIRECVSLACLSNPCRSGSTCLEHGHSWTCVCPSGYLGDHCEKSVCENNPCQFGATCVSFPASGFICLCPLGKHGQFCEYDLDIGHPIFSSTVGGLSSFSAHTLPAEIHRHMVLSFKFIPYDMEQIALMVFVGQDGPHGPTSDHLAVSFIKGYVVLTWNLGSGPRRIFTSHPIADWAHRPHMVQIGRNGQKSWLVVDNFGNVTGKSPGPLTQLNTRSVLYFGGHDSANFSLLPHDLPLHTGFSGCLYDARLQTGQMIIMLQQTRAVTGRSVGQCGTSLCHEHACKNGGGCIHHGATFTCLCADGWFGPTCALLFNPCDSSRNNCSSGSTCVPLKEGYACDCQVGRTGEHCEVEEELSDIRLNGVRSYLSISSEGLHQHQSSIDLEVMPTSNHGLLIFSGRTDTQSFVSLSLQGGVLELRVYPGKHRRRGEPLIIRSRRLVALGQWHRIRLGRYGRRLFLWVEGTVNSGLLLPGETIPPASSLLYIGGVPDPSTLPPGSVSGHVTSFQGCVRRFARNWKRLLLDRSNIVTGRNIADCDGTACGGDVCDHGGHCSLNSQGLPRCTCTKEYVGERCEIQVSCLELGCQNGGRCVRDKGPARCACPTGWGGPFCETTMNVDAPYFGGDSYMVIDRTTKPGKELIALTKVELDFVYINFTTAMGEGMIMWCAWDNGQEYFGIGLEDGLLKLVWAWEAQKPIILTTPGGSVSDGTWHDVAVSFEMGNVTVWADHQIVRPPRIHTARPLVTNGLVFIGGFPRNTAIADATRGHFTSGFKGCLQKLAWGVESIISNFSKYSGENIGTCDL